MADKKPSASKKNSVLAQAEAKAEKIVKDKEKAKKSAKNGKSAKKQNGFVKYFKDQGFPLEKIWFFNEGTGDSPMYHGHHIDLWRANAWLLESCGILRENIRIAGIDTYSDPSLFSARREGVECGRIISAINISNI